MINYLSIENFSKAFADKVLFQDISFGIGQGQKVALIAKNGAGKSTLLRAIMGEDPIDDGKISWRKDLQVGFLSQNPDFQQYNSIEEVIFSAQNPIIQAIRFYEKCLLNGNETEMQEALQKMDEHKAWDYEIKIKQILSKFRVDDLEKNPNQLSGGQRKRLALAKVLIDEPEFLILDEPTNHLDVEMIEWLENHLSTAKITLLMVTHDRYFLEEVCNEILELDNGNIYRYTGNYSYFLEKKEERETLEEKEVLKAKNLMRKELDWIRRQPKARGTKAKYRIDAFHDLKATASKSTKKDSLGMGFKMTRLGGKILELKNLQKSYGELKILENFEYIFKKQERIGIVGKNGVGKSTFLNIITQNETPDTGEVIIGDTIVFGYYTQEALDLPKDKRVIEVIQDIAEYIPFGKNEQLSAAQLLTKFLFPPKVQYAYVSSLSGGEKRRLYLLTILVKNPNFLILDEPTNDLDIMTLQVLEDFLLHFQGVLIIVSHDRYFMNKLVEHLFVFEGEGIIKDFNGSYQEYREHQEAIKEAKKAEEKPKKTTEKPKKEKPKTKLSYNEQREYEQLEQEIENLELEKEKITEELSAGTLSNEELIERSNRIGKIVEELDQKTERWFELGEFV